MGDTRPEKAIAGEVVRALRQVGYHVSSTQQARASRQTEGMPDLFVAHPAWRIYAWIELKTQKGRCSPAQLAWHAAVLASGCPVLVVRGAADALGQLNALRGR